MNTEERKQYLRDWRDKNREKVRKWNREWSGKNKAKKCESQKKYYIRHQDRLRAKARHTTLNGVRGLNKREWTGFCELCGMDKKYNGKPLRLHYHHWNDSNLNMGMWICPFCHFFAERIENNMQIKYINLKQRIEENEPIRNGYSENLKQQTISQ